MNFQEQNTISSRIKQIRKTLGISQYQLAEHIGVSTALICKMEKGERTVTPAFVDSICTLFGVSRQYILTGTGNMFAPLSATELSKDLQNKLGLSKHDSSFIASYLSLSDECKSSIHYLLKNYLSIILE